MGSVIALIKMLLAKTMPGPFLRVYDLSTHTVQQALPGLPEGVTGGAPYEAVDEGHAQLVVETMNALPQTLRVFDRVDAFLKLRDQLHQACCGSALANRLMREMETAEADLQSAYNELLYPQAEYTPYKEKTF